MEQGRKAWRHASQCYGSREHSKELGLPARPEPEEGRLEGAEGTGTFSRAGCLVLRAQGPWAILCLPLLLLPSIFRSSGVNTKEKSLKKIMLYISYEYDMVITP